MRYARSRTSRGAAVAATLAVAMALAASCRTVPRGRPVEVVPTAAPPLESYVPAPVLRVGILTQASRVSLGADSGVVAWGALASGEPGHRSDVARATMLPAAVGAPGWRYRVQVASLTGETAAREFSDRARVASGLTPLVRWNEETRTYQVRVGEFATRDEALALASRLGRAGLGGAWVAEDPSAPSGSIRLLETGEEFASVTLLPASPGETLTVDGLPYRGLLEVRANESGTLTVINIVNVEDYLRGVVPSELSPQAFPQIEALKAQAVAARTYALRTRGQFEARGYDICATPACQVYRGKAAENPLSDQAVEATRGIAASYQGGLINALYTSTCGGHTEDGANVFEGEETPYLRGVSCTPERGVGGALRSSAATKSLGGEPGLNLDAALLVALDVVDPSVYSAAALKGLAKEDELRSWTARLVAALRRKGCESGVEPPLGRRGTFFRHLVGSLCWEERARRLLSPRDPDYLLQVDDRAELLTEAERMAAALLVQEGILSPLPDNTLRPGSTITRAQAVGILARAAVRGGAPGLVVAEFHSAEGGRLTVRRAEVDESYPVDPAVRLFRSLDGSRSAAAELSPAPGDKVNFVLQGGRVTFLEAEESRLGAAADRTSRYYRWEVRLTPAEIAKAMARYGSVGTVRDVIPRRIGVSGRVVELAILGSEGELVLKGLKVRWALGLRENLFVIDRETAATGAAERFVFTGKGWGHGVGLCQVGAFGMAQAGAGYEEILKHYYAGIALGKLY